MSTQNTAKKVDVLDTDLLEASGSGSFTKTVSIPEGTSYFRLLESPVEGQKHFMTHWYYWFKFPVTKQDGSAGFTWRTAKNTFVSKEHKNPAQLKLIEIEAQKEALAKPFIKEVVGQNGTINKTIDFETMPADVRGKYKALAEKARLLKPTRHVFVNAVSSSGELVLLRLPQTVYEKVVATIKDLMKKGVSTNPISKTDAGSGVWLEFTRTGKGFRDTTYNVGARMVQNGDSFKYDKTAISPALLETYESKGTDLSKIFVTLTDEELEQAINGDKTPIDKKLGIGQDATNDKEVAENLVQGNTVGGLELDSGDGNTAAVKVNGTGATTGGTVKAKGGNKGATGTISVDEASPDEFGDDNVPEIEI